MPYSFVRYNFPSCITAFNPISLITQIKYLSENQTASRKRSFYWGTKALLLLLLFLLLTGPIFYPVCLFSYNVDVQLSHQRFGDGQSS